MNHRRGYRFATLAGLLAALHATPAFAADASESPLEFQPKIDAPILSVAAAAWLTGELVQPLVISAPVCDPCFAGSLNAIDRGLAGQRNSIANAVSWATLGVALAAPFIADGIDVKKNGGGWRAWGGDVGLLIEAFALDGAFNQGLKLLAHRPRPFVYGLAPNDPALKSSESFVSFFSEHSSLTFTAASFYTTLFALRHPHRRGLAAVVGLTTFGLAAVTAALRVEAGQHFYTDVLYGAAFGTFVGLTISLLHQRRIRLPLSFAPVPGGVVASLVWVR